MKRTIVLALAAVTLLAPQDPPYRNARLPLEERVRDLLGRMTLEERFWQLFMIPGDLDNAANDYAKGIGASSKDLRLRGEVVVR